MTLWMDSSIRLSVEILGQKAIGLLDTGSSITVVSEDFAGRHGIVPTRQAMASALNASVPVGMVVDATVAFAGSQSLLPLLAVADLRAFGAARGGEVDILIGRDVLRQHLLVFDFPRSRFGTLSPQKLVPGSGWNAVALRSTAGGELLIDAELQGGSEPLLFDMGNGSSLILSGDYSARTRFLEARHHSTALLGVVGGAAVVDVAVLPELVLGGAHIRDIPTVVLEKWELTEAVGSIGLPLIAQFDVVLDLGRSKALLRRACAATAMNKDRSGLGLAVLPDRLRVVHVAPSSPAKESGWQLGEDILAIDGIPVDAGYSSSKKWHWRFKPDGTVVNLKSDRGRIRKLILKDYF